MAALQQYSEYEFFVLMEDIGGHFLSEVGDRPNMIFYCEKCGALAVSKHRRLVLFHAVPDSDSLPEDCTHRKKFAPDDTLRAKLAKLVG